MTSEWALVDRVKLVLTALSQPGKTQAMGFVWPNTSGILCIVDGRTVRPKVLEGDERRVVPHRAHVYFGCQNQLLNSRTIPTLNASAKILVIRLGMPVARSDGTVGAWSSSRTEEGLS
jgi:hypothetical protein